MCKQIKSKRMSAVLLSVLLLMMVVQTVFASTSWTDGGTWSLTAGDGYSTKTTTGSKLGATKTTESSSWEVYTVAKTMSTNPRAKLVNSSGETRSAVLITANTGHTAVGTNNTGSVGYAYYLAVKPAAAQTGTKTIKLQLKDY